MTPTKSKKPSPKKAAEPKEPKSEETPPDQPEEESEVESLREEVQQLQDALARTQAELVNLQKRHERERETAARYRVEPLARELLEILDAMEEAQDAMTRDEGVPEAVREGQALTLRHMVNIFDKFSIEIIDPSGEMFDPNLHEAVAMQPTGEFAPGSVMEVFRKGYRLQDRLLRPARVVVASEEPGGEGEETGSGSADETADPT
ncbi:MAG: nucleotide exchange factor GrpE [Gammaproteobacteria bacterium]|nr:nucleotide exchange factor GrpE [Gammaproteobacteria bacterium]